MGVHVARQKYTEIQHHEMVGNPPEGNSWKAFAEGIEIFPTVDLELLTEGDQKPFYVTLDIMTVNATSENGLLYDEVFVTELLRQLPGLGAKDGHTKWTDTGSFADAADWVGYKRIGDKVWAKAYIPPGKERDNIRRIIARGGLLRTSLEVWGDELPILDADGDYTGTYRIPAPELDAFDFVRFSMAALRKYQSGTPVATSETINEVEEDMKITLEMIPQEMRDQIIAQAESVVTARLTEANAALETAQGQVATLTQEVATHTATIAERDSTITGLNGQLAQHQQREFNAAVESQIAALTPWVVTTETGKKKVESLRGAFRSALTRELGDRRDATIVKETAEKLWSADFKELAGSVLFQIGGGAAFVGETEAQGKDWKDNVSDPEKRKEIKDAWGMGSN